MKNKLILFSSIFVILAGCSHSQVWRGPNARMPELNEFQDKDIDSKEKYLKLTEFKLNQGDFPYTFSTIQDYYSNSIPYILINEPTSERRDYYSKLKFKVNLINEFQAYDYYFQDFIEMQSLFGTDIDEYKNMYGGKTFLEAKRNAYSNFYFGKRNFRHAKPFIYMKEWGGLNHPPFHKIEKDLTIYDDRLGKPFSSEQLNHTIYKSEFHHKLDEISKSELTIGNKLKVYADRDSFQKKLELLESAKHSFWMSTLAYICDVGGFEFSKLALKKADEGIKIKIIYDKYVTGVTNLYNKNCISPLKKHPNIEIIKANDFFKYKGKAIYHVKEIIVDHQKAIMGGQNLIDADSLSQGTDFSNRDIDIYIEGPLVTDMSFRFIKTWEYFRNKSVFKKRKYSSLKEDEKYLVKSQLNQKFMEERGAELYDKWFSNDEFFNRGMCRYVHQAPTSTPSLVAKTLIPILAEAKEYIGIINPMQYDSLDDLKDKFENLNKLLNILDEKQKQGIKIDLLTAQVDMSSNEFVPVLRERIKRSLKKGNIPLANLRQWEMDKFNMHEAKKHYPNLLKDWVPNANTHVWTHISFIHSKVYYIDRLMTSIGSMNLNSNATDQAWESAVYCQDKGLNEQIEQILVQDKLNSIPLIFRSN